MDKLHHLPDDINPRTFSEFKTDRVLIFGVINSNYRDLSNYYSCDISYQNQKFDIIEQCNQHLNAMMFGDNLATASVLPAIDPEE